MKTNEKGILTRPSVEVTKHVTGVDGNEYDRKAPQERAGDGGKPGVENGLKILPEPLTLKRRVLREGSQAQVLVGSAGSARYSV